MSNKEFKTEKDFGSFKEYLECMLWLTTTSYNDIWETKEKIKFIEGISNTVASVRFYRPSMGTSTVESLKPEENRYWNCYTWLWSTPYNDHFHYKMTSEKEEQYPPIPKTLFDFWNKYNKLTKSHEDIISNL